MIVNELHRCIRIDRLGDWGSWEKLTDLGIVVCSTGHLHIRLPYATQLAYTRDTTHAVAKEQNIYFWEVIYWSETTGTPNREIDMYRPPD